MVARPRAAPDVPVDVQVSDEPIVESAEYAEHESVPSSASHTSPCSTPGCGCHDIGPAASSRPVAQANLDVNGRLVRAQVCASTSE